MLKMAILEFGIPRINISLFCFYKPEHVMGDFPRSGIRNKQVSDIEFFLILPKLRKILHTLPGPTHERIQSI